MATLLDLALVLEEAAKAIETTVRPELWAGWVCYLLEALDVDHPSEIEDVLRAVKADIETRLALGRW